MESRFDNVLNPVDKTNSCDTMTLSEAVAYCKLSKPTIVKLLQDGTLPGGRFGSVWRIPRAEFIEAFEKRLRGNYNGAKMRFKQMYKAKIKKVFKPGAKICAKCCRKKSCSGALVSFESYGFRGEVCASHIPREALEKARERGESILLGEDGRIALEKF